MQNLVINGVTYNGVSTISAPLAGGGTSVFLDTSDADAVAADITQDKTAYVNGQKIIGELAPMLKEDVIYYVSLTGSDTTGDGTELAPYRTVAHALSLIPKNLNGHTVSISIGEGTYTADGTVEIVGFYSSANSSISLFTAGGAVTQSQLDLYLDNVRGVQVSMENIAIDTVLNIFNCDNISMTTCTFSNSTGGFSPLYIANCERISINECDFHGNTTTQDQPLIEISYSKVWCGYSTATLHANNLTQKIFRLDSSTLYDGEDNFVDITDDAQRYDATYNGLVVKYGGFIANPTHTHGDINYDGTIVNGDPGDVLCVTAATGKIEAHSLATAGIAAIPDEVSVSTTVSLTVEENHEYEFLAVTSLTLVGAPVNCHGMITFGAAPTISVSGFSMATGDDVTAAVLDEVWEFSVCPHDGGSFIVWKNWGVW